MIEQEANEKERKLAELNTLLQTTTEDIAAYNAIANAVVQTQMKLQTIQHANLSHTAYFLSQLKHELNSREERLHSVSTQALLHKIDEEQTKIDALDVELFGMSRSHNSPAFLKPRKL